MGTRRKQVKKQPAPAPVPAPDVARTRGGKVASALANVGEPLDRETRERFEPRFGHSFGDVRVHADDQAAASAASLGATAYAVGNHVVFGAERYQPSSQSGQELLAHELAHVVQQSDVAAVNATSARSFEVTSPGDRVERDAGRAAQRALAGQTASVSERGASPGLLARQEGGDENVGDQVPADQAPAVPAQTGGGLTVQEVGAPHGSVQHSSRLNNTYSVPWTAFIENDVVLFEFSNPRGGPCTVTILLEDAEGNGPIGSGTLSFAAGDDSTRYLEFSGFPTRASGDEMGECIATITLTNDANAREGYEIYHKIYRG